MIRASSPFPPRPEHFDGWPKERILAAANVNDLAAKYYELKGQDEFANAARLRAECARFAADRVTE